MKKLTIVNYCTNGKTIFVGRLSVAIRAGLGIWVDEWNLKI